MFLRALLVLASAWSVCHARPVVSHDNQVPAAAAPGDAVAQFFELWADGKCTALQQMLAPSFTYTLSNFVTMNPADPPVVYSKGNVSTLCSQYAHGFAMLPVQLRDLGDMNFGLWYGADMPTVYPDTGGVPCITPFLVDVAGRIDANGQLVHLAEALDVVRWGEFIKLCNATNATSPTEHAPQRSSLLYHLWTSKRGHDPSLRQSNRVVSPQTKLQLAETFVYNFWTAQCDKLGSVMTADFTFLDGHVNPQPMNKSGFVALCYIGPKHMTENQIAQSRIVDGDVITLTGPSMVAVLDPVRHVPCASFFNQSCSVFLSPTDPSMVSRLTCTYDQSVSQRILEQCHFKL